MGWNKIRLFHAVAEAGNFTRAGEKLGLNQSSLSRQIKKLEHDLKVSLFHRHARGLVLTEHGEVLFKTAQDMRSRLQSARQRLADTKQRAAGDLKVTATVGIGGIWLTQRISEFLDTHPDVDIHLALTGHELDLSMREADIAIRLQRPEQPDLIQRRLFTIHYHAYASHAYLDRFGNPKRVEDLDHHRIVCLGGDQPAFIQDLHRLATLGRDPKEPRRSRFLVDDSLALRHAIENGAGIGIAPDYAMADNASVTRVLQEVEMPTLDSYLAYSQEMRSVARVQVFRDFLVSEARSWAY